jgi:hypothetical protein
MARVAPPTSSSLAEEKRLRSLLLSTPGARLPTLAARGSEYGGMAFMIRRAKPSGWEAYRARWSLLPLLWICGDGSSAHHGSRSGHTEIELGYPLSN